MSNAALVNFAAGETSPESRGRFDMGWFASSCEKLKNFICEVTGTARYRPGFEYLNDTGYSATARLIPFQLSRDTSYMLEFSDTRMRAFKDGVLVTSESMAITGMSKADPCVISGASTAGFANGDEVVIRDVVGMLEANGRVFKILNVSGTTVSLTDPLTNQNVASTTWGVWISGGTMYKIARITSPYLTADLPDLQFASSGDTLYLTHPKYAPRKVTVDAGDLFTLATYSRTDDPFVATTPVVNVGSLGVLVETDGDFLGGGSGTIGMVWLATGAVVDPNTIYTMSLIVGTTELNTLEVHLVDLNLTANGQSLWRLDDPATGLPWDTTGWTAWISGGIGTPATDNPLTVAFYEGRLVFGGTNQRPNTLFFSMAPDPADGLPRYDTFTGGADADDAAFFTLAPLTGQVDFIAWVRATARYLYVGTYGGPFRVSGGGLDTPITPTSINVRQFDTFGCEPTAPSGGARIFFIQRGGTTLRSTRYNTEIDDLESINMTLNAEHLPEASPFLRTVRQAGRPDIIWVLRADGTLTGMTVQGEENIAGWHRQVIAGVDAKIVDIQVLALPDGDDQLWAVVRRTIAADVKYSVEVLTEEVVYPEIEEFYTTPGAEAADEARYWNALYRKQEEYRFMDSVSTYNGSDRGVAAAASMTPGSAALGTGVSFTASTDVFTVADIGKEIWKKPSATTGIGSGRALITAFTSATVVTATITSAFDSTDVIPAGDWYFAVKNVLNLWHLVLRVAVVADGAVISDGLTDDYPSYNGSSTDGDLVPPLDEFAAVIHIGYPYEGLLKTQNLNIGGSENGGPTQAKPRNIVEMFIRFLHSLGTSYGTSLYRTEQITHRSNESFTSRPSPVFSGIRKLAFDDNWSAEEEKHIVVTQRLPLPCTVQSLDVRFDVGEEE